MTPRLAFSGPATNLEPFSELNTLTPASGDTRRW